MRKGRRLCYGKPLTKDQEIWAGTEFTTACWKASPMGTALKGEKRALRAPQSSVPRVKWQWDPQHRAGTSSSSQLVTAALEPNSFHLQPL